MTERQRHEMRRRAEEQKAAQRAQAVQGQERREKAQAILSKKKNGHGW